MSLGGSIARRYARALLTIGEETGRLRGLLAEVERVASAIDESKELREVLQNPMLKAEQRKKILEALLRRIAVSKQTRNACMLLLDRGRVSLLPPIARELRTMVDEVEGVIRAEVVAAGPLAKDYLERLRRTLRETTGKRVELTSSEDSDLIAGVVTRVGGVVYDGSLRAQLKRVREHMLR